MEKAEQEEPSANRKFAAERYPYAHKAHVEHYAEEPCCGKANAIATERRNCKRPHRVANAAKCLANNHCHGKEHLLRKHSRNE